MKMLISEEQFKKLKHQIVENNQEVDEIKVFDYKEPTFKGDPKKKYVDVVTTNTKIKDIGPFTIYYDVMDEYDSATYIFNVVDNRNKEFVGFSGFDVKYGNEFLANFPYIRPEYRGLGIAKEMYKMILNSGTIISGSEQSKYAINLWKSLYKEFPNMKYVDQNGEEFPVYLKNDELLTKDDKKVYDNDGERSYLKIPQK